MRARKTLATFALLALLAVGLPASAAENGPTQLETQLLEASNHKLAVEASFQPSEPISQQALEAVNWYLNPHFICDSRFRITFEGGKFLAAELHSGTVFLGEYALIAPNHIRLKPYSIQQFPYYNKAMPFTDGTEDFRFEHDQRDFWYTLKLVSLRTGFTLYALQSKSRPGGVYRLEETELRKVSEAVYETLDNLIVRERPSKGAKQLLTLKKGTLVNVYGIATAEETIDGMRSSWYYIDYAWEEQYCPYFGWVFGGYLREKK